MFYIPFSIPLIFICYVAVQHGDSHVQLVAYNKPNNLDKCSAISQAACCL